MPRTEEAEAWSIAVYTAIQEIPYGKVTSYGHIALLLDQRTTLPPLHISGSTSSGSRTLITYSASILTNIIAFAQPKDQDK